MIEKNIDQITEEDLQGLHLRLTRTLQTRETLS